MKTLNCTAKEIVARYMTLYSEGWHCITILMILWNQEATFKRHYIASVYPFEWHSNVWHLIDSFKCHVNSMQTDKNDMKVEQSVSMHSHALKRPCKRRILTDPKSRNASYIYIYFLHETISSKNLVVVFSNFRKYINIYIYVSAPRMG